MEKENLRDKKITENLNFKLWLKSLSPTILRRCRECGEYTLNQSKCPRCGGSVYTPIPPKFSPDDKYAKYRRMMKEEAEKRSKS